METPRIAPLAPPYSGEIAETLEKMMASRGEPLKLFRTLAHHPRLLKRFSVLGGGLLRGGLVEPAEREIVIHRTCARCRSENEWGVHLAVLARSLEFSEDLIAATVTAGADDPVWGERQGLLIRLADELHETATISGGLWETLERHWEPPQLIELIITAGFYHLVSYVTNALGIELEDYGARFPAGE